MTRRRTPPDTGSRERLLAAGLDLVRQRGTRALTVRAAATAAGANLGSFVYHFGSREAFLAELLERWYAPLAGSLQVVVDARQPPLDSLRGALLQVACWLIEHRGFVAQLLLDASAGEPAAQRFLRGMDSRHPAVLLQLIGRAQAAGNLRRDPPLQQLLFLMSTLALPVLALHLLDRTGLAPPLARELVELTLSPDQARKRLDWALRGLVPAAEETMA